MLESHVVESLHSVSRGSGFTDVVEITVSVPSRESVTIEQLATGTKCYSCRMRTDRDGAHN